MDLCQTRRSKFLPLRIVRSWRSTSPLGENAKHDVAFSTRGVGLEGLRGSVSAPPDPPPRTIPLYSN